RVPVAPAQEATPRVARAASSSARHGGVTLRLVNVVADAERTALRVVADATDGPAGVVGLGEPGAAGLVLQDDRGRQYDQRPLLAPARAAPSETLVADLVFAPLAADARAAYLVVPRVVVSEPTDEISVDVAVGGRT